MVRLQRLRLFRRDHWTQFLSYRRPDNLQRSQYDLSPAFLLMAAAAVSFLVIAGLRETYKLVLSSSAGVADAA
jgi:hypothetical protein